MGEKNHPHISWSRISQYLQCPKKYEYQYIRGIKAPISPPLLLGTIFHAAVERNYRQKIVTGKDLSLNSMADITTEEFHKSIEQEHTLPPDFNASKVLEDAKRFVVLHQEQIAPYRKPALVEQGFSIELWQGCPMKFVGFWDMIEADGTIVDNKTYSAMSCPDQDGIDRDLQFSAYSYAFRKISGKPEAGLRMDIIVKNRVHPKAVMLHTTRSEDDLKWFFLVVEPVVRGILEGRFPRNPLAKWCGRRFCHYYDLCYDEES